MIGKITGRLDYKGDDHALIDTGGVAYLVYCSERTLASLPAPGETVALYTELLVREDLMQLFGFLTLAEREWYRLLTSVQGVGAKGAIAVLGALGADGVSRALSLGDVAAVRAAPGIGPKIAQRMVLELQAKAPKVMALGAAGARPATPKASPLPAGPAPEDALIEDSPDAEDSDGIAGTAEAQADALSALVHLGYGQGEAASVIAEVSSDTPASGAQDLIRAALQRLAPKG